MSALGSPTPRPIWKLPGWGTLWGSRVPESPVPPVLAAAVFLLTLAGLIHTLVAGPFDVSVPPALRGYFHLVLPWLRALCALLVAAFALGAWLTRGGPLALLLAGLLPAVGLLAACKGFALWQSLPSLPLSPDSGSAARAAWPAARLVLATGLQLAWAGPWLARAAGASRLRRWAVPSLLTAGAAAFAALTMAVEPGRTASGPLAVHGVILALLVAAVPAVARLHRREAGLLSHATLLSLIPQIGAQIASLASVETFDTASFVAQGLVVLALLTLLTGVILEFVAIQRDRTRIQGELQRANAELLRELQEKERYYQRLRLLDLAVQRLSVGVTIADPAGRIIYVNPADAAMHGYTPGELLGQPARIYAAAETGSPALPEAPTVWRRETLNRTKDGRTFPVRLISDAVLGEDGRPQAVVTLCEDITRMQQVERMKQEFLATVSHELRTPLTSMLGAIGLVRSTRLEVGPDKVQELLEITERNGARLLRLINDLLDLQRLEAGELPFHHTETDLGAMLADAVQSIQGFADVYRVRLSIESSLAGTGLVTDRERLIQVLHNLLSNAIKFSPAGEEVRLAARAVNGHVEVVVSDRGPGIPEEFRGRLFEKFAQADASHARRQGGSGLGLSISKKLVEGLGGTIDIASSPQAGTTVTVRLPLAV